MLSNLKQKLGVSTSNSNNLGTISSFEKITKNPKDYENKAATLKGKYDQNLFGTHFLVDSRDFYMQFRPKYDRAWQIGKTYEVIGVIRIETDLDCEENTYNQGGVSGVSANCVDKITAIYLEEGGETQVQQTRGEFNDEFVRQCEEGGNIAYPSGDGYGCVDVNTEQGARIKQELEQCRTSGGAPSIVNGGSQVNCLD